MKNNDLGKTQGLGWKKNVKCHENEDFLGISSLLTLTRFLLITAAK